MCYSGGLVTIPVPQDVNNPYQYVSGTPRRTPHATTSHPLLTGTQQPSISQTPSCGQRTPTSNNVSNIENTNAACGSSMLCN